jgi:hypothetical protein
VRTSSQAAIDAAPDVYLLPEKSRRQQPDTDTIELLIHPLIVV